MSDHSNEPHPSEPVFGHDGIAYEARDAKVNIIVWSLLIIAALTALGFVLMLVLQKYFQAEHPVGASISALAPDRIIPPAPQVQIHPWEDLPEMRATENQELNFSGRDKFGRMHIPIAAAMTEALSRLKVAPDAPRGLNNPGGQGIEFSHENGQSVGGGARPQIQGEIRKNAQ